MLRDPGWRRLALATIVAIGFGCTSPPRPPNVILIIGDDQAWTDFGFMGHPAISTPHLDRLAAGGALFRRAYVPASLCRPSLASIITGRLPHEHGITSNDPPPGVDRAEMLKHIDRAVTLPDLLQDAGYRSFQSGKWWEGGFERGGFDAGMTHGDPARGGRHGDDGLAIGRQGLAPVFDFIDAEDERPFFVWYAPFLPHTPHNPPERLLAKYRTPDRPLPIAKYLAMCEWFDETCGELLGHLDAEGLTDDTLVVFVTDNGWINRADASRYAPRSKRSPYEGGIRTPIILSWPGRITPVDDDTNLITSLDLAPTILRTCGIQPPTDLRGIDLLPVARGEMSGPTAIFGEIFSHDAVDLDDPAASLLFRWCIEGRWKLILPVDPQVAPELYDLLADPFEQENRAAEQPDRVRQLTDRIESHWPLAPRS